MYSLPSTSNRWEPSPRAMNGGVPPTLRNARTGEFTPPGIGFCARVKSASDFEWSMAEARSSLLGNHFVQEKVHQDLAESAVQIAQETALEVKVRLRTREQILHQRAEAG